MKKLILLFVILLFNIKNVSADTYIECVPCERYTSVIVTPINPYGPNPYYPPFRPRPFVPNIWVPYRPFYPWTPVNPYPWYPYRPFYPYYSY